MPNKRKIARPSKAARSATALPPVAIVVSRYNATITDALLAGAIDAYADAGGNRADLRIIDAPGAFEVVTLADHAAATGDFGGVVCLGCIIKGETKHDDYLAHAVTTGIVHVSLKHNLPVTNGVLTVNTPAQATARAGGKSRSTRKDNKGAEAMSALLATLESISVLHGHEPTSVPAARPDKLR